MTRNCTIQVIALIALIVFVSGAAVLMKPINKERQALQLDVGLTAETSAVPPHIILQTAALGSFRGLLVDFLWYRVNQLKEEGKYFEINALSQYITTLQPRFPQVWAFHAWNMAYNISVTTHTPEERWSWVNNGITLLRDQGIPLNPRAVRLYRELSWIFFHKIGQFSDDMQWYYKAQLAREWEEILGRYNTDDTTQNIIGRFRTVVEAPATLAQVEASSAEAAELVATLRGAGIAIDTQLLKQINRLLLIRFSYDAQVLGLNMTDVPQRLGIHPQLVNTLANPRYADAFGVLVAHLRKRALVDVYHMDPAKMLALMEEFGPIDWRHPAAHGQYWSTIGTEKYDEIRNPTNADLLNTYRQKLHSFQDLTRYGRISYDYFTGSYDVKPDWRFIPAYDKAFDIAIEMAERTGQENVRQSYGPGHENFLLMATMYTYLYGDAAEAEKYFLRAKNLYADEPHNKYSNRYNSTVQDVVIKEFADTGDMMSSTRQFVDAMVLNGLQEGLYNYNMRRFNHFLDLAKKAYDRFHADKLATPLAPQNRMSLAPFDELVIESYTSYMLSGTVPVTYKARVWVNTPPQIKLRAFTSMRPVLYEQVRSMNLDPERMFPAPEGWKPPDPTQVQQPTTPSQPGAGGVHVERK